MMRLAGIWVKSKAVPSQAGPSVKRGLKGPATISNSQSMVSPPASQILYTPPSSAEIGIRNNLDGWPGDGIGDSGWPRRRRHEYHPARDADNHAELESI